jgi:DNA-binding transcriptional ArsR family regulator
MALGLDLYIATRKYSYMEIDGQTDRLSLAFGALADPTRRAILDRLASGEADVSELMKPFALSQPTISKHLNVLERARASLGAGATRSAVRVRSWRFRSRISLTGWSPFADSGSRNLPAWILT